MPTETTTASPKLYTTTSTTGTGFNSVEWISTTSIPSTYSYITRGEPTYTNIINQEVPVDTITFEVDGEEKKFTQKEIVSLLYKLKNMKLDIKKLYDRYAPGMGEIQLDTLDKQTSAIVDVILGGENNE